MKKTRGVFEKVPGSGEWWIQYFSADGRRHREKAGSKANAITLVGKRRAEVLTGKKLPEKLRARVIRFSELAADAELYCKRNNVGQQFDIYRLSRLKEAFGNRPAVVPVEDLRAWLDAQDWENGTFNRYKTTLSTLYRLGMENGKVQSNPAKLLKHKREDNGRVRFLNQFSPDEESRLRAVILAKYPEHMAAFEIALNTGMRPSEQFSLRWPRVDLLRKLITIPTTKNGKTRHISLNTAAISAFRVLQQRSLNPAGPVFVTMKGQALHGYKHWFDPAVAEAAIPDFTWYCLRHTFASRLVMSGADLRTVAELMGHKTIQMTMRYAHLAPAHQLAAVERLASFQEPTATSTATSPESQGREESFRVN